ncbi:ribokinase [Corynebacterium minutissimum]|uniref:ribokinase n=1 Tax=Corynebacterium minutissimum TaxID=38301 RepID=UPI001EF1C490|nr:ribokinase [Corynebacterium minutissimum]MCG7228499.1 ribokinase [Corynebacterium minutissimum]MCG7237616.1 ribokinase [Corynebacterium minutissimum]
MKLLVVGGYGVGLSFFTSHAPADGETVSGARMSEEHGGKGSNQAVAASRLGASVGLLTAVGSDKYAEQAKAMWEREGIESGHVDQLDGSTMMGCIVTDKSGENRIIIADGVLADYGASHVRQHEAAFREADCVLVSCEIPLETVREAISLGRENDCLVILNPAPAPRLSAEDWKNVDVVTPNRTEAAQLLRDFEPDCISDNSPSSVIAAKVSEAFNIDVVMTNGGEGCLVATSELKGEATTIFPVIPERVVDTTGAGDSFNGALATAMLGGVSAKDAAKFAVHNGAFTVEKEGVIKALPTREQLKQRYGVETPSSLGK